MKDIIAKIGRHIIYVLAVFISFTAYGQRTDAQIKQSIDSILLGQFGGSGINKTVLGNNLKYLLYSKTSRLETITASGTNTYTATLLNPTAFDYTKNPLLVVKFTNANSSTTPTLNPSTKGAKTLVKNDGTALSSNDIKAGSAHLLWYNGTTLQILTLGGGSGGGTWGSITGTLSSQTDLQTALNARLVAASNLSDLASASTARTNLGVAIGSNVQAYDADLLAIAGLSPSNDDVLQLKSGAWANRTLAQYKTDLALQLIPTGVKTGSYTAVANDLVITDATSGTIPITLPTAPADKTLIGVKMVTVVSPNTTTIATGGADVFNKSGGATSFTMNFVGQSVVLQYKSSGAIWYMTAANVTDGALTPNPLTTAGDGIYGGTPVSGVAPPTRLALGGANTVWHGGTTAPSYSAVVEADQSLSDITTNNFSTTKHGYVPKGTNVGNFLRDDGTWAAGSSGWGVSGTTTLTGAATIDGTSTNITKFRQASLGTTQTDGAGLWLQNQTAASVGAQQVSPSLVWEGNGWKTTSTAASQSVQFKSYVLPVQGTTNPSGQLKFSYNINAGGNNDVFVLGSNGDNILNGGFQVTGAATTFAGPGIFRFANLFSFLTGTSGIQINSQDNSTNLLYIHPTGAGVTINGTTASSALWVNQTSGATTPLSIFQPINQAVAANTSKLFNNFKGATVTASTGTIPVQAFTTFETNTLAGSGGTATSTVLANISVDPATLGASSATSMGPLTIYHKGKEGFDATETAGGTTGAQTINKPAGSVNFAATASTLVVTNSLAANPTVYHVFCQVETVDTTAKSCSVTRGSGSFTITLNAAATAETRVAFFIIN